MQDNAKIIDDMFNNLSTNHQKKTNDEFKLREFEWYDLETKIRTFVYKLMEPHLKSNIEQKSQNEKLALKLEKHIEAYNEFRNLCLNQGNEIPIIQTITKNIDKLNKETQLLASKYEFEIKQVNTVSEQTTFKIETQELQLKGLYDFKTSILEEMSQLVAANTNFKNDLATMLDGLCNEQVKQQSEITKEFSKFHITLDDQMHVNNDNLLKQQSLEKKCDYLNQQINQQLLLIVKSQQDIQGLQDIQIMLKTVQEEQQRIQHQYGSSQQKMQSLENYLEKYQPLYIQGLISDTLHSCLPDQQKTLLAQFEEKKFTEMHQIILNDNGISRLQEKMEEFSAFVEHIVKRNKTIVKDERTKEIMQKKKSKQIDNQSENSQSQKSDQDSEDASSVSERNVEISSSKFAQFQNKNAVAIEQIEFLKVEIKNYFQQQFHSFHNEFSEKVRKLTEQVAYLDESLHLNITNMINQVDQASQSLGKQLEEYAKRVNHISEQLNPFQAAIQSLKDKQNFYSNNINQLLQYCILSQHLALQDEIDRQGLALFGVKEQLRSELSEQEKKGPTVQIDQNCLSCNGQSAIVVQAFKLACLSYQPNEIVIEGKHYKREHLLEVCQQVLNRLKLNLNDNSKQVVEEEFQEQCTVDLKQYGQARRLHSPFVKQSTQISDPIIDDTFKLRVKTESTSAYTQSRQRRYQGSQERKDKERIYLMVKQQMTTSGSKSSESSFTWHGMQPFQNKKLLFYGKKKGAN